MTPDTAARAQDHQDKQVLEAFKCAERMVHTAPIDIAAASLITNWPESQFYKRHDLHNVAAEITAIKSQIDAESEAA